MMMEILLGLAILGLALLGVFQDRKIKRYETEFARSNENLDAVKSRLEDRFYLEAIFNSMEEEVMLINRYMEITDINPAVARAAGLSKEEILGKYCYEVLHNRAGLCQPPHGLCPIKEIFSTGEGKKVTHIHTGTKGEELVVEISATPIKNEDGAVIQVIEVSRNVTEREQLKRQMVRTEKLSLIENCITDVCHDIIDPLNIVTSNLQLLQGREETSAPEEKARIESMMVQANKIAAKVNNLLEFIRKPSSGASAVDIREVLEKVLELVEKEITLEGIELYKQISEEPLSVFGKGSELSQVFLNILNSARETMAGEKEWAAPSGEGWKKELRLAAGFSPGEGEILVEIKDQGKRIPDDIIQKLHDPLYIPEKEFFDLFRRLSICYKIVEEHGGTLTMEGIGPHGNVYLVRLPKNEQGA